MTFKQRYFNWLFNQVTFHLDLSGPTDYKALFKILYRTPFAWVIDGDMNRMADALELRDEYADERGLKEYNLPVGWLTGSPSVLEVLVRFARRAEFNSLRDETVEEWFWIFLDNLGLSKYKHIHDEDDERDIDEILYRFIWRDYDYNGKGGMFPLYHPKRNQAQVEIWYQFHAYIQDTG